ncbi:MAG: CDP-alcohol phosphatidyltransferase family protein [Myxococcota bacterium]
MLSEIVAIYRASKKKKDINWWTEWVCRPPAAVLVYALRNTPITPNQVTFLSLVVCAVAGAIFVGQSGHAWVVLAALVFELSFILDCVDGQLARYRDTSSVLGHLLDFLIDEIKAMLLFGCVGIHLWRHSGDERILLVTVVGLFCLASGIAMTSFMRRPEYGAAPPTEDGQPAPEPSRRGALGRLVNAFERAARFVVHYPAYILVVAAFDRIDIYFWAYSAVNVLYLARCMVVLVVRLGHFRRR